ncbi:MAG: hypothetical protein IT436_13600 [Phycisphaerales bacterium]|nr:hypothetical protein [Phycisphaerales bacterium]
MSRMMRYQFEPEVPFKQVEDALLLAVMAVEGLAGESAVRLDAAFNVNQSGRTCLIDAATEVGSAIARVFTGLVTREFGAGSFHVRPVKFIGRRRGLKEIQA